MAHHGEALICFYTEAITRAATILESSEPALQRHIATYHNTGPLIFQQA
jgi:hypothetical protein